MRTCFSTCRSTRPGIVGEPLAQILRDGCAAFEIVAEDLERDLGAHAGQHVIEPMRDRLPDIDRRPAAPRAARGCRRRSRPCCATTGFEVDLDLGGVHALGMLVEFGAAGAAADDLHLGHLEHQPLGDQADAIRFGERDAGIEQHVDGERAFVERRQEGARQHEARRRRPRPPCNDGGRAASAGCSKRALQQRAVSAA